MKGYPRWFLWLLLASLLLLLASGLLLVPTTLVMRADMDLPWRLPGAGRLAVAVLHAAGGFLLLLLAGALWSVHMRSGWRRHQLRASGATLGAVLMGLAVTAIALYYAGEETPGLVAALAHIGLGLVSAGLFGWHWVRGRQASRARQLHAHAAAEAHEHRLRRVK